MLRDITIGRFFPGESFIHKLDPRFKILASMTFIISLFIVDTFRQYIPLFMLLAAVIWISKIPVGFILKGIKPIIIIMIFAFGINVFFTPGEEIFSFWKISVTKEGLYMAAFMVIRLLMLITGTSLLTLTTSPIELTDGLETLFNPYKRFGFPAHELAMMMTIALRFIPTLLQETDKIMKAQMARGADFESGNLVKRAKSLIPLLVPLFVSAFRRADELAMAMEARCYSGGHNRTRLRVLKYTTRDFIGLIAMVSVIAVSVALGRL